MIAVSYKSSPLMSEEYTIKFWYRDDNNEFVKQGSLLMYSDSKDAHQACEDRLKRDFRKDSIGWYEVISVTMS